MLPVVAVQVSPAAPAPDLEERLLSACSTGLERARCVAGADAGNAPRAIAMVSWIDATHVSIEVGLAGGETPAWLARELEFKPSDPELERWRAVGFTVALLVDDQRFWAQPAPGPTLGVVTVPASATADRAPLEHAPTEQRAAAQAVQVDLRALAGAGLVNGPWRAGAELRFSVPFSSGLFVTGSANYALAQQSALDVRWFDMSLGVGLYVPRLWHSVDARLRLEALGENVAVTARRADQTDQSNAWVPGVSVGGDLLWHIAEHWLLSARADAFGLDGSTVVNGGGTRLGTSAGAGVLVGLGAGRTF